MIKIGNFPEWVFVHHTGGTDADPLADTSHHTFEVVQQWHLQKGWENFGYHWMIEKDGTLKQGRPEHYHGAHAKGYNTKSIGILLAGNFDATLPTEAQIATLKKLLKRITKKYTIAISNVQPHRSVARKTCYGNLLSNTWAQELLEETPIVEEKEVLEVHPECPATPVSPSNSTLIAIIKALLAKLLG